ncbi:MAG: tRNA (guanosine(37)-N1)-methyltransferase TrmD [Bacteroidetes bacterium]|nr:tRNA (guanosine(37)-N1)-methyltransferase TrmD [Bacteroidota bacterium]
MRIDIISAVPGLLESPLRLSIPKRAVEKGLAEIQIHNLHEFGLGNYRQIDDYPFGGGAGMVLMAEPLGNCLDSLLNSRTYDAVIYMSPDGERFHQKMANRLSMLGNLIIICGHYKGIDQRIRDLYVTQEISLGDFVLSGGEIAAAAVTDAILRLIPGVLGNEESALSDTFQDDLLAPPLYTRPVEYKGLKVPDVLISGDHARIEAWRMDMAEKRTAALRPDLYNKDNPENGERE